MMSARRERNSDIPVSCDWYEIFNAKVKKKKSKKETSRATFDFDIKHRHQTSNIIMHGKPVLNIHFQGVG